jgi:alpha-glucosidase
MFDMVKHWLDRGVDGFRFDAVTSFYYAPDFPDNPPSGADAPRIPGPATNPFTFQSHKYDSLPEECGAFTADMREWAGEDFYLLGEVNEGPRSVEVLTEFTRKGRLDACYIVDLAQRGLTGAVLGEIFERLDDAGTLAWWLSSHDQPRPVSRSGDGSARDARMMAALLLGLPGPLLLFQGEELGLTQPDLPREVLSDPFDRLYWPEPPGRTGARTPIPWEEGASFGFSDGEPWLPVHKAPDGTVACQNARPESVLNFYRQALALRRQRGLADATPEVLAADEGFFALRLTARDGLRTEIVVNLGDSARGQRDMQEQGKILLASDNPCGAELAPRSALWRAV